jgi:hypothetical protein
MEAEIQPITTDLIVLENKTPLEIFTESGARDIVAEVTAIARSVILDPTTEKGRKEISSLAYKVSRTKTTIDKLRENLVADEKARLKAIDAAGKIIRDDLDALRDEISRPVDEFKERERLRVEAHKTALDSLKAYQNINHIETAAADFDALKRRLSDEYKGREWEEYAELATDACGVSMAILEAQHAARLKYDADQAELAELRKKQDADAQRARDAAIARAAIEREQERAEADKARLEAEKKAAEDRAAKAEQDAANAAQAERDRQAAEEKARQDAAAARARDMDNRRKINNDALNAILPLLAGETPEACARAIVEAIAKGEIPHVTISY